ncbi:MAG TPA: 50S ribosomal protein L25/general stress protein Ctc [Williamwhitmania sp.]|nr:50S ribosomal protein L25/general stress protein Ctc [Williamwhitmania sp.]
MKTLEIVGALRANVGKKETKALRNANLVPCVLYGGGDNVHFSVEEKLVNTLIFTPNAHLVNLKIGKKEYSAVMQDCQFHPVSDKTLHVDFVRVFEDKKVAVDVPVLVIGTSEGVRQGGKLQLLHRKIRVSALPAQLPDSVTIDITGMEMGSSRIVGEIVADNFEIITPKNSIIATVKLTRAARGAAAATAETPAESK